MHDFFETSGPEAQYREYLRQGKFMLQRAENGDHVFYPRTLLPGDARQSLTWVEAKGRASVYAFTIVRRKPERGGDYCVALVDLAEGPRMMARVEGITPDDVYIGMPLSAKVEHPEWAKEGADPAVVFYPETTAEAA